MAQTNLRALQFLRDKRSLKVMFGNETINVVTVFERKDVARISILTQRELSGSEF